MNRWIMFLTVAITLALTVVLNRIHQPDVWVRIAMAIGVATLVATVLVTAHAIAVRISGKHR